MKISEFAEKVLGFPLLDWEIEILDSLSSVDRKKLAPRARRRRRRSKATALGKSNRKDG